jgi:glycosyltransferase involved in cell wall biosynthesis
LNIARARLPTKWILICCGRDDSIGESLRALASSFGIANNIIWSGARNDARELWAAADIGINASLEEGFSNAVLEGMAAGVPMLVTDVGGNAEAVTDDECGRVVNPNSLSEIADAIVALSNDGNTRQRMGAAAKVRVEKLFSLDACVDQYASLYSSLTPRA